MADDDEYGKNEHGDVDTELNNSEGFFSESHPEGGETQSRELREATMEIGNKIEML